MNVKDVEKMPKIIIGGVANREEVDEFYKYLEAEEEKKKFDDYIIAYIDFLGIKEKMNDEGSHESLQILEFLLMGTKRTADYISKINSINKFEIKIFSDNIIIAQKIDEERVKEQIISMINLMGSIQLQALLQFDFWLRGGMTIGELFIDNSVVWGKGLIEAYNIEDNLANYPRIVLSNKLLEKIESTKKESLNSFALIKKDFDGLWFVDFLLAAPNLKSLPTISKFLGDIVMTYANKPDRVKQKINWMITYFNSHCCKYKERGDYDKYTLSHI